MLCLLLAASLLAAAAAVGGLNEQRVSSSCHADVSGAGPEAAGFVCDFIVAPGDGVMARSLCPAESCWSTDGQVWCSQLLAALRDPAFSSNSTEAALSDGGGGAPSRRRVEEADKTVNPMDPAYNWTIFVIIIILIVLSVCFEQLKDYIEDELGGPDTEAIIAQMVPPPPPHHRTPPPTRHINFFDACPSLFAQVMPVPLSFLLTVTAISNSLRSSRNSRCSASWAYSPSWPPKPIFLVIFR